MSPQPPDFARLKQLHAEIETLARAGTLTKIEFDRIFLEAEKAVGDDVTLLQSMLMEGHRRGFIAIER